MQDRNRVERRFAEFYDLYVADFQQDVPIYLDLAAKHGGPVLEAGCRTGRLTRHLARAGIEMRAIDSAREQLDVARRQLAPWRDSVRVTGHDLRDDPLWEGFPVALVTLYTINGLIDLEEQRLYMRNLRRSLRSPGLVALDCFCPIGLLHPEVDGEWRTIERQSRGHKLRVQDRRELLTPLLERRTQIFSVDDGPEEELVTHRRYLPPMQMQSLLEESGFEGACWIQGYDASTLQPVDPEIRPTGPFIVMAES
jgi:SAM-dependent methyltransferase